MGRGRLLCREDGGHDRSGAGVRITGGRVSWSDSTDDWVGCGDGFARSQGLVAVCDLVFVAISALSRDRVDVSRRLCARGDSDVACCRSGREADVPADYLDGGWLDRSELAAVGGRTDRGDVFVWRAGCELRV